MPLYTYRCTSCEHVQEETCSMHTFREFEPDCDKCGNSCSYEYVPTVVQVAFKDGPSGSWPSKGNRFKAYRAKASADAARRQKDRYGDPALIPNYKGEETGTWAEAQSQALSDKDNPNPEGTASTFDRRVASEKVIKAP